MARKPSSYPTELELEILKVLWDSGPMRVREVREALASVRGLAYTTVMTMMGIMTKKGYLRRTKADGGYIYRAVTKRDRLRRDMMRDFVDRVFGGSPAMGIMHLLESSELDDAERAQIRALINRKEHGK